MTLDCVPQLYLFRLSYTKNLDWDFYISFLVKSASLKLRYTCSQCRFPLADVYSSQGIYVPLIYRTSILCPAGLVSFHCITLNYKYFTGV